MAALQKWRIEFAHRYGVTPPANAREEFMRHLRFVDERFWWVGPSSGFEIAGMVFDPEDIGGVLLSGKVSRGTERGI